MAENEPTHPPDSGSPPPKAVIRQIVSNVRLARALSIVAELGIADFVADAPKSAAELATATGAHADSLYRLLRMLASHGVFAEDNRGHFHLTPLAAVLRSAGDDSLRASLRFGYQDLAWDSYRHLMHTVMTGETAFDHAYGMPFFDYSAAHSDVNAAFHAMMAQASGPENAVIVQTYDFGQHKRIVDVGGGKGGFLAAVLTAYPEVHGVLYDQPQVVADPMYLRTAGVLERCNIIGGNFFESVPEAEEVYVLKRIVHDWDDAISIDLLRRCRDAMAPQGRVLVIDAVLRPGNEPDPNKDSDIMLMAMYSGRERTEAEFRALYDQAGLQLTRVISTPLPSTRSIVEGVRA